MVLSFIVTTQNYTAPHLKDDPARRRSRPERIPPSNPEEVDAARRGEWNYETGCIEKKEESPDDEIDYSEY